MRKQGINNDVTRRANRRMVLEMLCTRSPVSRLEIAQQSGLTKMTVTNITAEYLERGLIREIASYDADNGKSGRKKIGLAMAETAPCVIGIWLSRDSCLGILTAMDLEVLGEVRVDLASHETESSILEKLLSVIRRLEGEAGRAILGVGLATIGPLDAAGGVLLNPPSFYGIQNFPVAQELEERCGHPVLLQNDMNAAALAEHYFGSYREHPHFAYVGLTNGIGAGIVLDGKLFEGAGGFAGELGHLVVDMNGPLCRCGNRGCLETFVDVCGLPGRARPGAFRDFHALCEQASTDAQASALLAELERPLVAALTSLCNLVDPELLLFGHEGAYLPPAMLERLQREINRGILARGVKTVLLRPASFGATTPAYGAAAVVLDCLFRSDSVGDSLWKAME